jgi:hypothetical protein
MEFLKNIFYRLRTALFFLHSVDRVLDFYINQSLEDGLLHMCVNRNNYITMDFKSGRTIIIKSSDRYFNWGDSGIIIFKGGKIYKWENKRMSAKTLYKLQKYLGELNISCPPCI